MADGRRPLHDAAALQRALDPGGAHAALAFDTAEPGALATRTMQLIVDAIVEGRSG